MEAHPLRGAVRWLIYPLLAIAAGCLAGVFIDLYQAIRPYRYVSVSVPGLFIDFYPETRLFGVTSICGVLGGAVAVGLSLSPRRWMGVLVAPVLGALGVVWVKYVLHTSGWTWAWVLSGIYPGLLNDPGPIVGSFFLAAPLLGLHGVRLHRARAWPLGWLVYAAAAAPLWVLGSLLSGKASSITLAFLMFFNLGSRAAWEAALKLSGAQLGRPSSRVASS